MVTVIEGLRDWHPNLTPPPFQLIGLALGIFLGFRNHAIQRPKRRIVSQNHT